MRLFTIGFTKKTAERFFSLLNRPGLVRVIDIRLNNSSQLAGFTKRDDLAFFLRRILGIDYIERPELAPTKEILDAYRTNADWEAYSRAYLHLLKERHVEDTLVPSEFDGACLLCSEPEPDHCHRRLAAEYLAGKWGKVDAVHL
jgi:uncharacterized protein (DUF488 family)